MKPLPLFTLNSQFSIRFRTRLHTRQVFPSGSMPTISPLERLKQSRAQCTVTFTADETAAAERVAIAKLGASVTIEGFRPGKAPPEMIRAKIKDEAILDETVRTLLPDMLESALKEHQLKPILPPKVEAQSQSPLKVRVTFVEQPEVHVGSIDTKAFARQEPKFDEKDVDRMTEYLLSQYRTMEPADRAAEEGDQVTMDFVGNGPDGAELQGTRSVDYQVVIGSKTLLPGFEDGLKGLKKGDKKDISLTFPEKYHAEQLQGKPVTFAVQVKNVEKVHTPELTDEFVMEKQLGESVPDLRARITDSMRAQEEQMDGQRREQAFFDAVSKATKVDLAPELVDQEERSLFEELAGQLQNQNMEFDEWMKRTKRTPEALRKELHEEAQKRVTLRFGIQKLIEDRAIDLTPEERQTLVPSYLATVPEEERLRAAEYYREGGQGYEELLWRRKVEKLVGQMLA